MIKEVCRQLKGAVLVWSLAVFPQAAMAGTPVIYTDEATPVFQIDVPDFWTLRSGGLRDLEGPEEDAIRDVSRVFGLTPDAHDGIWVGLVAPFGVVTLEDARAYLKDIAPFLLQSYETETPKKRRINGLPAWTVKGRGKRDGSAVEFTAIAIDLPNGRVAVSVVIFEAGSNGDLVNDVNAIFSSFRAIR
jgi:hypothetical protein